MKSINFIFPHQLFKESPLFETDATVYLVEEYLFFKQYPFHKQKIAFHRATMKRYADFLRKDKNLQVFYIDTTKDISDIRQLIPVLKRQGIKHINYLDPTDNWLQKRIEKGCLENDISTTIFSSPLFLNTKEDLGAFFRSDKKKYHQTSFYTEQRKKLNILLNLTENQQAVNGLLIPRIERNILLKRHHHLFNFQMLMIIMKKPNTMLKLTFQII